MEYYKVIVSNERTGAKQKEEYYLNKSEANFAAGFYRDNTNKVQVIELNTDNPTEH